MWSSFTNTVKNNRLLVLFYPMIIYGYLSTNTFEICTSVAIPDKYLLSVPLQTDMMYLLAGVYSAIVGSMLFAIVDKLAIAQEDGDTYGNDAIKDEFNGNSLFLSIISPLVIIYCFIFLSSVYSNIIRLCDNDLLLTVSLFSLIIWITTTVTAIVLDSD